jgi:hypothetical protein
VVTSKQFLSGRPPNIAIPRGEVEVCFIGDENWNWSRMSREETAGIPLEMPWRIYVPRHKNAHRDEVILVVSFSKSM